MLRHFLLTAVLFAGCSEQAPANPTGLPPVETVSMDGVDPLTRVGNVLLAGQPSAAALEVLAKQGTTVIVDLRTEGEERGFDEPALAEKLGVRYHRQGFGGGAPLTDEIFGNVRQLLQAHRRGGDGDLLLHCAASVRVGAVWLAARVLDEGVDWDTALGEARRAGLSSSKLETRAREYVDKHNDRSK